MRWLLSLTLAAGLLNLASGAWAGAALAQTTGPDGTPQVEAGTEVLSYVEGATPELLTHYWIVLSGVDSFPPSPSPEQVEGSDLRKRLLDLRLTMDLNAYAFQPGT